MEGDGASGGGGVDAGEPDPGDCDGVVPERRRLRRLLRRLLVVESVLVPQLLGDDLVFVPELLGDDLVPLAAGTLLSAGRRTVRLGPADRRRRDRCPAAPLGGIVCGTRSFVGEQLVGGLYLAEPFLRCLSPPFLSGWYRRACFRYAFLTSVVDAVSRMPSVWYGLIGISSVVRVRFGLGYRGEVAALDAVGGPLDDELEVALGRHRLQPVEAAHARGEAECLAFDQP